MLKFYYISRAGTVTIFLWKNLTSLNGLKFHMHVSDDDSNMFCKFDEIWWIWKNVEISWYFKGRHCRHFSVKKINFFEKAQISHACFWWWLQYVLQVWWNFVNFEKMLKFHDIIKGRHCRHFLWKNLTSLKRLKFHMHVSDDDYNMFCKFDEIWWILKKCWNFIIFLGPSLLPFFCEKFNFSEWAQISHACFWWWFQYVLQVWWNLVNFEKMLKFHDISRAGTVGIFLLKN